MNDILGNAPLCWCGNTNLSSYSEDYFRCDACGGTLIAKTMPSAAITTVDDEDDNLYGRNYWFEHQQKDLNQPTILARARSDLSERVLHWTQTLLQYQPPPSTVYELGSGHGGLIAMLRALGYDATGSELSPSIVEIARRLYAIPMRVGTIEEQGFPPDSFDAVVLMDVLEHLTNPLETMAACVEVLRAGGILLVQTPAFPAELAYDELVERQHPFIRMMIPAEHLFLFSKASVTTLLLRLGVAHIAFEEPIFAHYDMFFAASRQPLVRHSSDEVQKTLEESTNGRLIQAMIDLEHQRRHWLDAYQQADTDRTERLKQVEVLNGLLQQAEARFAARLQRFHSAALKIGPGRQSPIRLTAPHAPDLALKCIVVDLIPILPGGENGGAKLFTLQLIKDLVKLLPECRFVLLTADVNNDEISLLDAPNTIRYCIAQRNSPFSPEERERFIRLLRQAFDVDLLFCPFTLPIVTLASVPIISVIYDLQYLYYPEFFSGAEIEERERNFRQASQLAAYVVCISEHVRKSVLDHTTLAPERVRTIYLNAAQVVEHAAVEPDVLARLGLGANEYWLYPANFWRHKNHQMLLAAFSIYRHHHPDSVFRLVCTGAPGERMNEIQHFTRLMGLESWVVFPGFMATQDFTTLLNHARALVYPSLYEGFGIPILEAMTARTPVLCSDITSLPEVAGDAALLFDPRKPDAIAEALQRSVQETELMADLTERGVHRAALFGSSETTARQYIELFHEAIRTDAHRQNAIRGIYSDGWIEDTLTVTYKRFSAERLLSAEFHLPHWVHDTRVNVIASEKGQLSFYTIEAGQPLTLRRALSPDGGTLELLFYPPLQMAPSADKRQLTCQCSFCHILVTDQTIELFPVQV